MGFLDQLKEKFIKKADKDIYLSGFERSKHQLRIRMSTLFDQCRNQDEDWFEELMMILVESDISVNTANNIIEKFKKELKKSDLSANESKQLLISIMSDIYGDFPLDLMLALEGPTVVLIVGVNGSGKTTTIAKLAQKYKNEGLRVAVAAGDTFRAAAIEQLNTWAMRIGVPCIAGKPQQDPASVMVDACRYAKENNIDVLLCDTAGRLQNKTNLMNELAKMFRVIGREIEGGPHAVWLVLDATTGQNGLSQAKVFMEATEVGGIILTKMDGTARGGIVLTIKEETGIGVIFLGLGEKPEDLRPFDKESYLFSLFEGKDHVR
jgi:fused signal recognition particle receptor